MSYHQLAFAAFVALDFILCYIAVRYDEYRATQHVARCPGCRVCKELWVGVH